MLVVVALWMLGVASIAFASTQWVVAIAIALQHVVDQLTRKCLGLGLYLIYQGSPTTSSFSLFFWQMNLPLLLLVLVPIQLHLWGLWFEINKTPKPLKTYVSLCIWDYTLCKWIHICMITMHNHCTQKNKDENVRNL